jgi:hypothetical protein
MGKLKKIKNIQNSINFHLSYYKYQCIQQNLFFDNTNMLTLHKHLKPLHLLTYYINNFILTVVN